MIPSLSTIDAKSIGELTDLVAKQTKEIQFLFEGNIDADNIRANSITADLINVTQLSAITADLGVVTAGYIEGLVITGGVVRTSSSGERIELVNDTLSVYDYNGNLSISMIPTSTQTSLNVGSISIYDYQITGQSPKIQMTSNFSISQYTGVGYYTTIANSAGAIYLISGGSQPIYLNGTDVISSLSGKANVSHTHDFSSGITGKPTTLSGYGITSVDWSYLTGKPTTISGYGITDAYTKTQSDANYAAISHTHSWSAITTGKPTTLSGYGITDTYTSSTINSTFAVNLTYDSTTKNLKLFSNAGVALATVNIAGS
ncbi:hypothetical protein UFOVP103_9 [uncultured Caudovirales phage]|uniref:Uncharacterized protein n=1 Tax=uncultured Caudovirales phage TaxID=2100421 RepID=A0A6J7WIR3_9CAUD|nr:hypothetical protein UFOVP103_9 [uncultured Caudovirales phage]CAB5217052.1 hypothetical protein UFOVP197_46 [uncultured Caudovirales phage]